MEEKPFEGTHLMFGYYENEPKINTFTQTQWMNEASRESTGCCDGRQVEKWSKNGKEKRTICLLCFILTALLILLTIFVSLSGYLLGKRPLSAAQRPCVSCPESWVGYEGTCYYFSDTEGTWDSSQSNCSSYGASLASIDTQQEMGFVMRYKGRAEYWIGLRREEVGNPWRRTNGSIFNVWFKVAADGLCAYLDDDVISSTWCSMQRNWICSKSL